MNEFNARSIQSKILSKLYTNEDTLAYIYLTSTYKPFIDENTFLIRDLKFRRQRKNTANINRKSRTAWENVHHTFSHFPQQFSIDSLSFVILPRQDKLKVKTEKIDCRLFENEKEICNSLTLI